MLNFRSTPPEARRGTAFRAAICNDRGAIDLASVMAGVIVLGVIGGVISATVFAVVPWSQDQAARQNLSSITLAEQSVLVLDKQKDLYVYDSHRQSQYKELEGDPGLQGPADRMIVEVSGDEWLATSLSDSGRVYFRTSDSPTVHEATETAKPVAPFTEATLDKMVAASVADKPYVFTRAGKTPDQIPGYTGGVVAPVNVFAKLTWSDSAGTSTRSWKELAFSSDGTRVAAASDGFLFTSTDSGATFTDRGTAAGSRAWTGIASSADGQRLAATVASGYIWTSNDGGASWISRNAAGSLNWQAIAMSADGSKLVAVQRNGSVKVSKDSGATWTSSGTTEFLDKVSMSADGSTIVAAGTGFIRVSRDGGTTWSSVSSVGASSTLWSSTAITGDGKTMYATTKDLGGAIFVSKDAGVTWSQVTSAGAKNWQSVAVTADGTKLVAVWGFGYPVTSLDGGATWVERTDGPQRQWAALDITADGGRILGLPLSGTPSLGVYSSGK